MKEDSSALLALATKANRLASRVGRESESNRVAGRLVRDPHDWDALSRSLVYEAKAGKLGLLDDLKTGTGFLLLQFAIVQVSYLCWEDLWNGTHPQRFGQAWDGEDPELMSIWRRRVRTIINECHQDWLLLVSDVDKCKARLVDAGASEQVAEEFADWLSNVRCCEPSEEHK
jgi:hypothetical protein